MTELGSLTLADSFAGQNFAKLILGAAEPTDRRFEDCRFSECRFSGPALRGAAFIRCSFEGCDLSNWDVTGLRFIDVKFRSSKLVGIDWTKANRDPLTAVNFEECLLDYGDFSRLKLPGLQLLRCSVKAVNFDGTIMTGADCRGADFAESVFNQTDLTKADFREARGYAIDPRVNKVTGASFSASEALNLLSVMGVIIE